ncbi:MAG: DUF5009 domain-containing protein [Prevotella sp.]|nr:DUF5009 domain-containing protein [Prevotella sp.]
MADGVKKGQRLMSLDIMRGMTVAGMILVNNGYGESFAALQHSKWNGMTPCDLVFPFFIFIMGISTYLSLRKAGFKMTGAVVRKIVKRTVLLFLIGLGIHWVEMALDGRPWDFAHLRIWSVLGRIALCYFAVSMIAITVSHRHLVKIIVGLLVVYSAILILGHGYDYDSTTNILAQVDLRLFGYDHLYHKSPVDPEGLLGTISSVAHVLIGFYCGKRMMDADHIYNKVLSFLLIGGILTIAGWLLSWGLPLNKRIWSPSYVMVACGLGALLQGMIMYSVDVQRKGKAWKWALVFGVNPLFLYVASELLAIFLGHLGVSDWVYSTICSIVSWPKFQSLAYALSFTLLLFLMGWPLYKRKIYIKL